MIDFGALNKYKPISEEDEKEIADVGGSKPNKRLTEGFHEDCSISIEIRGPHKTNPGLFSSIVTYGKDGAVATEHLFLPVESLFFEKDGKKMLFPAQAFKKFCRILGLYDLNSAGLMVIANNLVLGNIDLKEYKANVKVGYGNAWHTVKVEDPQDPSRSVIKIAKTIYDRETKAEKTEYLKGEGISAEDAIFSSFEEANNKGMELKSFRKYPEVMFRAASSLNIVSQELLDAQAKCNEMAAGGVKPPTEPAPEGEPEEKKQGDKDIFGDVPF